MFSNTLGIVIFVLLICGMLGISLFHSKLRWQAKAALIAASITSGLILWSNLAGLSGWPTTEPLPERFLLQWMLVEEPSKNRHTTGAIYLWITPEAQARSPLTLYRKERLTQRLYRLEYSRQLHEQLEVLKAGLQAGQPTMIQLEHLVTINAENPQNRNSRESDIRLRLIPPPLLPSKN